MNNAQENADYLLKTHGDFTRDPHNPRSNPLHKALGLMKAIVRASPETKELLKGKLQLTYPKYLFVTDGVRSGALTKDRLLLEHRTFWGDLRKMPEVQAVVLEELLRFEEEYRALFTREVRRDMRLVFAQDRARGYWLAQEDPRTKHVFEAFAKLSQEMNDRVFNRLLDL